MHNEIRVPARSESRGASPRRTLALGARGGALLLAVLVAISTAACSGTPQVRLYKGTAYTVHAVKTAMLVFNDEYQAGRFTEQDRLNVIDVYEKYRKGMLLAIKAQKVALDAQGQPVDSEVLPAELQSLAADVISFIESLRRKP